MTHASHQSELIAPVSLLDTLKAIEEGTLTTGASIEQCMERLALCETQIHAFTSINGHSIKEAETSKGPLAGIGVAIKDIYETERLPTEYNSEIYRYNETVRDAPLVATAFSKGCTMIGKSATTEFAYLDPGPTRNPHNPDHTPGGSSSGSAAAIATGMAHLAFGTQTAGSVIRPASYCGVTGYKPTAGLLPKGGVKELSWTLDTVGLFAKTVADCAYASSVLADRNLQVDPDADFSLPKLGLIRSHKWQEADPDYLAQFLSLLDSLRRFGVEIHEFEPSKHFLAASNAHQIIHDFEALKSLTWEYAHHKDKLSPLLRQALEFAQTITPADYDEARICADYARRETNEFFEEVDAFISLSATGPAPKGLSSTGSPVFNRIWTLFGLPCINVTGLKADNGLPLGVQIIGPFMGDHSSLKIAHWLEGAIERHCHS
ncbi:amidase [uncultured Cohaesibacter sp.]|uniref:amidase n=1 Tax=uncultured Cohaesibacter sp. TaxID=1002546 RepID=UPI00292FF204|nr:amidase [uncultured Cohaesibacter sp.]